MSGSQDGFGTGKWRDVDATAKTWTLGGGSDASTDDGIEYDPNVLDIVRTDDQQETILAGYDVSAGQFAQLTGFEMPEISQQIYAANAVTATDSSVIISWSTTKESPSQISCAADGGEAIVKTSDVLTISHQMEVDGLTSATNYTCTMTASPGDITDQINVMTSSDVDDTPPQILNVRATTDETGMTTVSWFTDEDTFGEISLGDLEDEESEFGKNHQVYYALCVGDHEGEITATDPSGNTATQTVSFTTEGDGKKCSDSGGSGKVSTDDEASMLSSTNVQIVVLVVILLVFLALIRTRKDTFE